MIVHLAERSLGHRSKQSTQDLSDHSLAVPSERRIQTEQGMNQQSQLKNPPPKKRSPRIAAGGGGWTERSEGNPGDLALRCHVSKFTRSVVSLVPRFNHGHPATASQPTSCLRVLSTSYSGQMCRTRISDFHSMPPSVRQDSQLPFLFQTMPKQTSPRTQRNQVNPCFHLSHFLKKQAAGSRCFPLSPITQTTPWLRSSWC